MTNLNRYRPWLWPGLLWLTLTPAMAQLAPGPDTTPTSPERPTIENQRWQENWSVLADPSLRTEPFDALKYIPLSPDPDVYLSLGANARERVESFDAPVFGVGHQKSGTYLLDRLEIDADLRIDGWQAYVQLQDDRAAGKPTVTPVDADMLDLEEAFIAYVADVGDGVLKLRAGRQEFNFDLQRFISARDGPNVRQAFDAIWGDYEIHDWRIISFASHPTQYRDITVFDDYSDSNLVLDGFRVERRALGPGDLAIYYLRYQNDMARFAAVSGMERRNAVDIHYDGKTGQIDFDAEFMGQQGTIANRPLLAWAFGGRIGYSFPRPAYTPSVYVQVDAASGNTSRNGTYGTFNPLFPNGYYFPLAGLTTYANLVHVKPVFSISPAQGLSVDVGLGLQWRQTTQDAIYTIPTQAIPNTLGRGDLWSAAYLQLDIAQKINAHITVSAQIVQYQVGETIRRAGGHDTDYAMVQLSLAW